MKDIIFDDFQNSVQDSLLRHKSILDITTKLEESQSRINRAVAKSVTSCGCIKINACKQRFNNNIDELSSINDSPNSHLEGKLCDSCRETVEREIGNHLFYITSLCNSLDLNLYDILIKECDKMSTLGKYTLR